MMSTAILLGLQVSMAALLMWASFCRLVQTDHETHAEVRWSIVLQLTTAGMLAGAPFMPLIMPADAAWPPLTTPLPFWLAFVVAAAVSQLVSARLWTGGHAQAAFRASRRSI